jgi:threonine aldolase
MNFASDTAAPVHPAVLEAHRAANDGFAPSYGEDAWSARLEIRLREIFETEALAAAMVNSGTAANALLLSVLTPPLSGILCHEQAHLNTHERGAPEFFTGGSKLLTLPGEHGRIEETALRAALDAIDPEFTAIMPPGALSLSNLTEAGAAYGAAATRNLCSMAKAAGLRVHIDGARLANAIAATGASPADLTWRAGADALSLGLTKTGAATAEIMILFGAAAERMAELQARRKRAGHSPPKARFAAAEALAMLEDGLWLRLAARANAATKLLAEGLAAAPGAQIRRPAEGNLVFARLPETAVDRAKAAGATFHTRAGISRFVCSWATTDEDVGALLATLSLG